MEEAARPRKQRRVGGTDATEEAPTDPGRFSLLTDEGVAARVKQIFQLEVGAGAAPNDAAASATRRALAEAAAARAAAGPGGAGADGESDDDDDGDGVGDGGEDPDRGARVALSKAQLAELCLERFRGGALAFCPSCAPPKAAGTT